MIGECVRILNDHPVIVAKVFDKLVDLPKLEAQFALDIMSSTAIEEAMQSTLNLYLSGPTSK